MTDSPTFPDTEYTDDEPHLTEMDRQAETRVSDDGYWD